MLLSCASSNVNVDSVAYISFWVVLTNTYYGGYYSISIGGAKS